MSFDTMGDYIARYPSDSRETLVAVVFNDDGTIEDCTYNWETAQNIALSSGGRAVAINDDGSMSVEDAQALYEAERERYDDCFGVPDRKPLVVEVRPAKIPLMGSINEPKLAEDGWRVIRGSDGIAICIERSTIKS